MKNLIVLAILLMSVSTVVLAEDCGPIVDGPRTEGDVTTETAETTETQTTTEGSAESL
jgi:hypothetical protein